MPRTQLCLVLSFLAVVLVVTGCAQKSPEERVAEMRSRYEATVNTGGFVAQPRYPEVTEVADGEDATDGEEAAGTAAADAIAADDEGGEGAGEEPAAEPTGYDIILDIIISNGNRENLPQLTVDIVHLDSGEQEKGRWQATFDVSGLYKGGNTQETYTLEDVDYTAGDIFYTEIRSGVAAGEYSSYPEYSGS